MDEKKEQDMSNDLKMQGHTILEVLEVRELRSVTQCGR